MKKKPTKQDVHDAVEDVVNRFFEKHPGLLKKAGVEPKKKKKKKLTKTQQMLKNIAGARL